MNVLHFSVRLGACRNKGMRLTAAAILCAKGVEKGPVSPGELVGTQITELHRAALREPHKPFSKALPFAWLLRTEQSTVVHIHALCVNAALPILAWWASALGNREDRPCQRWIPPVVSDTVPIHALDTDYFAGAGVLLVTRRVRWQLSPGHGVSRAPIRSCAGASSRPTLVESALKNLLRLASSG